LNISIIIPTYGRQENLRLVLESLLKDSGLADGDEIIVVDDGSPLDASQAFGSLPLKNSPLKFVRFGWNKGPAAARNEGLRHATGDIVIFTGDDMIPAAGFAEAHRRAHQKEPDPAYAVIGNVKNHRDIPYTAFMRHVLEVGCQQFSFSRLNGIRQQVGPGMFYTCNLSVKREFILKNGLFDEIFPNAVFEDVELGLRLSASGMRLEYIPDICTFHRHSLNIRGFAKRQYLLGRSYFYASLKHPSLKNIFKDFDLPVLLENFNGDYLNKALAKIEDMEKAGSPELDVRYSDILSLNFLSGIRDSMDENSHGESLAYFNGWKIRPFNRDIGYVHVGSGKRPVIIGAGAFSAEYTQLPGKVKPVIFEPSDFINRLKMLHVNPLNYARVTTIEELLPFISGDTYVICQEYLAASSGKYGLAFGEAKKLLYAAI
jgi:glycosyltransferase involved in cell wall biosynthesis